MANEPLHRAIAKSGHDLSEIATIAEVDEKTVRRWLEGRIPHPRHRFKVAHALAVGEHELWPDTRRTTNRDGELVGAFARRTDPDAPDWQALLRTAERQVDMLGYSLLHIAEARGVNKLLTGKAGDGVSVRIALADPTSGAALAADLAQQPPGRLIARIDTARDRLLPLLSEPGIELREHRVGTSHTILRVDEQLLLTVHLYGTPGFQAPLIHLRRERDYGLFDQFAKHFEDIWQHAQPIGARQPNDATPAGAAKPGSTGAASILDRLDDVWRPS
jgi:hypothetical protein